MQAVTRHNLVYDVCLESLDKVLRGVGREARLPRLISARGDGVAQRLRLDTGSA